MVTSSDPVGVCPLCEGEGEVGQPCAAKVCRRRGYRFVPREHLPGGERVPDAMVGRMIDDYLVVSVLGAGGFGKVYLALQMPIRLKAALKLLHRDARDPAVARAMVQKFFGEAQALAALAHPNIVRLLKYGVHDEGPYLVMEFVAGARTLKDELGERAGRGERLDAATARHILRQIIDGLDAAHRLSIIHRDIKPENVMLQAVAGNPTFVRVVDFGLAKFVAERTETSMAMGTPVYMAPEQLLRRHIGPWTDLYAVGVIAYELMTGRRPFGGGTVEQIVAAKLDAGFDPLDAVRDIGIPDPAARFFVRALAREPEARYQDAASFRRDLEAAFDAAEAEHVAPMESVDLSGLFDTTERARLAAEQQALAAEREALQAERAALEAERRALSELRRESQPVAPPVIPADTAPPAPPTTTRPLPPVPPSSAPAPPVADVDTTASVSAEDLAAAPVPSRTRSQPLRARDAGVSPVETSRVDEDEVAPPSQRARRWPLAVVGLGVAAAAAIAVVVATSNPAADSGGGAEAPPPVVQPETQPPDPQPNPVADPEREAEERRQAEARAGEEACVAAARDGSPDVWRRLVAEHPNAGCVPSAKQRLELLALDPRPRLDAIAERLAAPLRAPSDLDPPGLLELATGALHELAPEVRWHVDHVVRVDLEPMIAENGDEQELLLSFPERSVVLVAPGRYVLEKGLRLEARHQLALLAGPETEIFARSGQAVLSVTDSEDVLLWGLYLNHHEVDVNGRRVDRDDCVYVRYYPRIKESDVVDLVDSRRVTIRASDLEGTGFIGVKAIRSRDVIVADTVIHDCISAAIHLEDSTMSAANALIYRVGARAYKTTFVCRPDAQPCSPSKAVSYGFNPYAATFKTAVFVDPASSLTMTRSTVVVPEPLRRSQAFEIEGQLVLAESVVQQKVGFLKVTGDRAHVSVSRVCTDAPESSAKGALVKGSHFGVEIAFPPAEGDVSFVNAPEVPGAPACVDRGADVGHDGIPRHAKPEPEPEPEPKKGASDDAPQWRRTPKATVGSGSLSGACDRDTVASVVRRHGGAVRACYETRLQVQPTLAGKLTVRWTIKPDGSVSSPGIASDTLGDAALRACVLRAVSRMEFPKPKRAGLCNITWPYVFKTR